MSVSAFIVVLFIEYTYCVEPFCYEYWCFGLNNPAPRKCPQETFFTYYDCCTNCDRCCEYIKWPLVVFFLFVAIGLLSGCCCICIAAISHRIHHSRGIANDYPSVPLPENGYEIPIGYHASILSPSSNRTINAIYALPMKNIRSEHEKNLVETSIPP